MKKIFSFVLFVFVCGASLHAKSVHYANVEYSDVVEKSRSMLEQHAAFHEINEELARRVVERFLSELDPMKMLFLESEIQPWLHPDQQMIHNILVDFSNGSFEQFQHIFKLFAFVLKRNETFEKLAQEFPKPEHRDENSMQNVQWAADVDQLLFRIRMIQAMEEAVWSRFDQDASKKAKERLEKRRKGLADLVFSEDAQEKEKIISTMILKAFAQALDSQSAYFTPLEAHQFVVAVQQKLLGIGVLFKDDIDGFSIVKIVEGGPAARQGELKVQDKVIAVDGEPVAGLDTYEVLDMIRGDEHTLVTLQVVRKVEENGNCRQEVKEISIERGEVVVHEARMTSQTYSSETGDIGHIQLHSFYQDEDSSSGKDVKEALLTMKRSGNLFGVILDLRGNPGGILQQAVDVCGLFMDNGLVCSIKDGNVIYPFWNMASEKIWSGPLVVLVDRTSASASEIVAQSLQDWGRAIIIGDDRTFGKGSFQMLSFPADKLNAICPKGEYKISRGRYYTASGKSPQLVGVRSDLEVCSPYRFLEIGEEYSRYPLSTECIASCFEAQEEVPRKVFSLRENIVQFFSKAFSSFSTKLQVRDTFLSSLLPLLQNRSQERLHNKKEYQLYCEKLRQKANVPSEREEGDEKKQEEDFACLEAQEVIKDIAHTHPL